MGARRQREPRFLWTGLLILIPVLALGAVGLWQLRQDRAAALAEARAEAEQPLEDVLKKGKLIASPFTVEGTWTILLAPDGETVNWPKRIPSVPIPNPEPSPDADALFAILDDATLAPIDKAEALHALSKELDKIGDASTAAGLSVKQLALHNALQFGKEAEIAPLELRSWASHLAGWAISGRPSVLTERPSD